MWTKFDKAAAAALASALSLFFGPMLGLDDVTTTALGTVLTAALVWLVPNAPA